MFCINSKAPFLKVLLLSIYLKKKKQGWLEFEKQQIVNNVIKKKQSSVLKQKLQKNPKLL